MLVHAHKILRDVKNVLENEEVMATLVKTRQEELDIYLHHKGIYQKISNYLEEIDLNTKLKSKDKCVIDQYNLYWGECIEDHQHMDNKRLQEVKRFHHRKAEEINLEQCKQDRLDAVLLEAKIEGETFDMRNEKYTEALTTTSHGYAVILERDIEEIFTNNYNAEWIKAWSGNMDIVICMDYFGVITYITDYYMKDESGTLKLIEEVLERSNDDPIKVKLRLVKNLFLTHRQVGESEAYYKLFPFLHLSHSNIGTVFILTGFPQNRSRFLKQIREEEKEFFPNVIEVEGKDGKFYIEKEAMQEKYENCPKELKNLFNIQFVKRYEPTKKGPTRYKILEDMNQPLTKDDINNLNYV